MARWTGAQIDGAILEHLPRVRQIAHHMARRLPASTDVHDLIQAGAIGLLDAATRYDPSRGEPFIGFAYPRITGAMTDELRAMDWMPRRVRDLQRRISAARRAIEQREMRPASEAEVQRAAGVTSAEAGEAHGVLVAIDAESFDPEELPAPEADDTEALLVRLDAAIRRLPGRQRDVVVRHFQHGETQRSIAIDFGVVESRVSQIVRQALETLAVALR